MKANTPWKFSEPYLGGCIFYCLIVVIMDLIEAAVYQCPTTL